ncbi:Dolichyl-phosphate-mannose-protein mannosyltransferase [Actinopolyspora alba]|uniref:Dolichyl-phosphate-mannose-protein mannosyltransferase n=2 Tax=Actinopolyspora alba TaxID=673379 RepID=A0A1I1XZD2_9ACTN|nr:Dolichyl-phosphate-mannose-protein mannosyltransferase [Actinopolyspora alba]
MGSTRTSGTIAEATGGGDPGVGDAGLGDSGMGEQRPTGHRATSGPLWSRIALAAILVLAAGLYGWAIGKLGWGNTYYSAAVKSMGESWVNFLFGSFDPAGVVTVDKPPAALWPQVISSKIFGVRGWALILPQVVEGVLTVLLLHRTVRRWAGESAGLIAALVLTLTPITVAINRDNNPDPLLMLFLVAAAYALTRASQATRGRNATLWLCGSAALIGCGFLTKMLAAWMVVPAFAVVWLISSRFGWGTKLAQLGAAAVSLLVSSLWWVAMVDLWPGNHPYIGGSEDGSAWSLVIGYNGLGRVFGGEGPGGGGIRVGNTSPGSGYGSGSTNGTGGFPGSAGELTGGGFPGSAGELTGGGFPGGGGGQGGGPGGGFAGSAGPLRLFNDQLAGQISWLLPLCLIALLLAITVGVLRRSGDRTVGQPPAAGGWALWGLWLLICGAVFSFQQGTIHPYYTTQLAPAVAALCGGLVVLLVRAHRAGSRWVPAAGMFGVVATVCWAAVIIRRTPDWMGWLAWAVLGVGALAAVLLAVGWKWSRLLPLAAACSMVAVLLAPGAWAISESTGGSSGMGGTNPTAGPSSMGGFGGGGPGGGRGGNDSGNNPFGSGNAPPGMSGQANGSGNGQPGMPGQSGNGSGSGQSDDQGQSGMPGQYGNDSGGFPAGGGPGGGRGGASLSDRQQAILDYAIQHSGSARIKLAISGGSMSASSYILHSDATVIGMGGFTGSDNAPSVSQLAEWTDNGELRYVLGSDGGRGGGGRGGGPGGGGYSQQRSEWIERNCSEVDSSEYLSDSRSETDNRSRTGSRNSDDGDASGSGSAGSSSGTGQSSTLYECA